MSKKYCWLVLILITLILSGCDPSGSDCLTEDYDHFDIILDEPAYGSLVSSLRPRLDWHHDESCRPDRFLVMIQYKEKNGVSAYFVDGDTTSFRPSVSLAAGGEYYWTVSAYQSSTDYGGLTSPEWIFYTGSPCNGEGLMAPIPAGRFAYYYKQGSWISPHDAYKFDWYYPGDCLPESYYYEFASDWYFTDILASGVTSDYKQYVELELPDCISGYWRVAAGSRGSHGPFSDIRRFFWASDSSCWMVQVPSNDLARLHGRVYQDYCPQTSVFSSSGPLPAGCVSSDYGVHADGVERTWEEGIESAEVILRRGDCPSPDEISITMDPTYTPDMTITDWYGNYEFIVQSPGVYCLTITKEQTRPEVNLRRGIWTEPFTEGDVVYKPITVPEGTHVLTENIGWDENDDLTLFVTEITHCRSGDSKAFPARAFIELQWVPLFARNQDGTWLKTMMDGSECYFYHAPDDGEGFDEDQPTEDEIMKLPVFESPPRPLPTPTVKKPSSKPPDVGTVCSSYTNVNSCTAAGCNWDWKTLTCTD